MAAGLGTRLRPFTDRMPKPLAPILGVPCAAFSFRSLQDAGVANVVANIHHLPGEAAAGLRAIHPEVRISDESGALLGSAGGIRRALPVLDAFGGGDAFFVLNADTICSLDLRALAATHARLRRERGVLATLALLNREEGAEGEYREVLVDASGERIVGLGEKGRSGLMYVGCAIIEREAVAGLEDGRELDFVREVLAPAISRGLAGAHGFSGHWMDVGSPRLWWNAHLEMIALLESGRAPAGWAELIEKSASRVSPGIWVGRAASAATVSGGWGGPCYWDGAGTAPKVLSAGAVLYGSEPPDFPRASAIAAGGHWRKF